MSSLILTDSTADLTISNLDGILVVDSRLIALRLSIQHESLLKTLRKYESKIEQRFGVLRFEIGEPSGGALGGRPEKYALLTEDQSTALMTFSKNTEEVVECKLDLVDAFSSAKKIIKTVIPAQSNRIQELQVELEIERLKNQREQRQDFRINAYGLSTTLLLEGKSDAVIEVDRPILEVIDQQTGSKFSGQTTKQLADYLNKNGGRSFKSGAELERELIGTGGSG
jgi:anti-repressor protein